MKIEFSDHAEERIKFRKISKKKIFDAIRNPDISVPSFRSRGLIRKYYGDKILEVVTKTEEDRIIIVTAYYLLKTKYESKIRPKN